MATSSNLHLGAGDWFGFVEPKSGPTRQYLTITEVSERTTLSVSTIQRLCRKGKLPYFQPGGPRTRLLFPPDVIEQAVKLAQDASLPAPDPPVAASPTPSRGPKPKWQGHPTK
jgi:excisionase family DNA binding protein